MDPFGGAQDKLVESFGFSAYLLSALRLPSSVLHRLASSIQHPTLAHFRHFSSLLTNENPVSSIKYQPLSFVALAIDSRGIGIFDIDY